MYCIQCEQTVRNESLNGCQLKRGMCGKQSDTAELQDILIYCLEGISQYAHRARQYGAIDNEVDRFIAPAFFTTLTNVNFDANRFVSLIKEAAAMRNKARDLYLDACKKNNAVPEKISGPALFEPASNLEDLLTQADEASIEYSDVNEDIRGLRLLLLYGLKGTGAYCEHAMVLGQESEDVFGTFHKYLNFIAGKPTDAEKMLEVAMGIGELNLKVMALLDTGHTETFGHPEPTEVRTTPIKGKAILVSGHDIRDLTAILEQTKDKGIHVYTHGELLPAHAYPKLKQYPHLVGNYGTAWQNQQQEFADFPGAIVMTSNCLIDPDLNGYSHRIFTCGPVGWEGIPHIENHKFSPVIECALNEDGFSADQIERAVTVGFARNTVMSVADKVIDGVKSGSIKHFFLIGGCDGAKPGRNYYTDFAENTPDDTVILTLGCGKYRFNNQSFGDIGGIPRLLDIGQCNDSYSAIQIAVALADAFDCSVNDLPLTLIISWFEQKAAAVLLTLLSLGITNIHLGPTLPAYLTPNLVNTLVDKFALKTTGDAQQDLDAILKAS